MLMCRQENCSSYTKQEYDTRVKKKVLVDMWDPVKKLTNAFYVIWSTKLFKWGLY